jgi:hypothetical protein
MYRSLQSDEYVLQIAKIVCVEPLFEKCFYEKSDVLQKGGGGMSTKIPNFFRSTHENLVSLDGFRYAKSGKLCFGQIFSIHIFDTSAKLFCLPSNFFMIPDVFRYIC